MGARLEDGAAFGDVPLVAAKLAPPPAPRGYLDRPRLSGRLDAALDDSIRLALVAAPPGYGKTLAVAGWLHARALPSAWLSLEPADGDLARFVAYLAAALAPLRPGTGAVRAALFGPGGLPTPELVGAVVVEAIAREDAPLVLVLDDYQAVASPPVHAVVRFLVEHGPPFCHPVLITREDPPLPVARLRAHGRLVELRAGDLAYTADEAAAVLSPDGPPDPDRVRRLLSLTEGWPAGLQLARLTTARGATGPEATGPHAGALAGAPAGPHGEAGASLAGSRFVLDYLADEVLDRLDPDLRDFLVQTSVADRFTADLCASITGTADARDLLDRAEREQLFLVPLDAEGRWYRYHQLFGECLRLRLDDPERRRLHARAACWLEANGLAGDAVGHFLAAGEFDAAARRIAGEARRRYAAGQHATLLGWLAALPEHLVEGDGELLSWQAWALFETGQIGAADALAARHLARVAAPSRGAPEGRLLVLRALLQTVVGPDAEPFAREGLELLGDDPRFRSSALQAIGLADLARGRLDASLACLREAFELIRGAGPAGAFPAVTPLAQALNATGRRNEAEQLCRELAAAYPDAARSAQGWYLDVMLGMLQLESNDVAAARRHLDRGFAAAARLRVGRTLVEWAVTALALARHADGDTTGALDALASAERDVRRAGLAIPLPVAEAEARIRLADGDVADADRALERAAAAAGAASPLVGLIGLAASVTRARIRLAQRRPREAAAALLEPETAYRRSGWVSELVSVLVLKAAAAEGDDRRRDAQRALAEAVDRAAPGGYVRRLVADGRPVAHLLPAVRRGAPEFVDAVLAALGPRGSGGLTPRLWTVGGESIEALTPRELDVLRLLADGARNDEVAASLGVSVGTARWHVGNVLAKLGERSRAKAVAHARELGIV